MALIPSEGVRLEIGDGASPEEFHRLKGVTVSRVEISQRVMEKDAVGAGAWQQAAGVVERRMVLDAEALATDGAAAARLRTLAMDGSAGAVRLRMDASGALAFAAYVTRYTEQVRPGEVTRVAFQLQSSGGVSPA